MAIGGVAAALIGANAARSEAASIAPKGFGRSVTDFGVEPNTDADQTAAMQKALNEISASGNPAFLPAGRYMVSALELPSPLGLFGIPGFSIISPRERNLALKMRGEGSLTMSGILFDGLATGLSASIRPPILDLQGVDVQLSGLTFKDTAGDAIRLTGCHRVRLSEISIANCYGDGIAAARCGPVSVKNCDISQCALDGIGVSSPSGAELAHIVSNRIAEAKRHGMRIEGNAVITANAIESGGQIGIRIGSQDRLGNASVVNNMVRGAAVGIAASSAGDGYALISMNVIAGARNGGVRALNGDELIGKDLTKGGSEAFRNLAIAANVSL